MFFVYIIYGVILVFLKKNLKFGLTKVEKCNFKKLDRQLQFNLFYRMLGVIFSKKLTTIEKMWTKKFQKYIYIWERVLMRILKNLMQRKTNKNKKIFKKDELNNKKGRSMN